MEVEKMLKRIAKNILQVEIKEIEEKAKAYEDRNIELRGKIEEERNRLTDEKAELRKEIDKLQSEKSKTERKSAELEKENEILRKYYDLDKEPSDEIKAKIHIDLEINRLKEENLKLIAIKSTPICIPQPYPIYSSIGRSLF